MSRCGSEGGSTVASGIERPKRLVTFYPEDAIVFRHTEPNALRKVCTGLRWKIISDSSSANDTRLAVFDGDGYQ
jgi:hypothetical protein